MAYIKTMKRKMKTHESVSDCIKYICNPEKVTDISCVNCSCPAFAPKEFLITRKAHGQDKGILAHHYVQSFSPEENITPEQAHEIAVELMKKVAPNFQYVIATHGDRDHVHNHIVINSCDMQRGCKWLDSQTTLKAIRDESDKLCISRGLSIIEEDDKKKYQSIDQETYNAIRRKSSWKLQLAKDLNEATSQCKSKSEFIDFMQKKNYAIRYTERHITFRKFGEKKGIRADTLAKQFGTRFTKDNLEKSMGYFRSPTKVLVADDRVLERMKFSLMHTNKPEVFFLKLFLYLLMKSKEEKSRSEISLNRVYKYRKYKPAKDEKFRNYKQFGTVTYRKLSAIRGENFKLELPLYVVPYLARTNILFSARMNPYSAEVTIKSYERNRLFQFLDSIDEHIDRTEAERKFEQERNKKNYSQMKKQAEADGTKLQFIVVTAEQLKKIKSCTKDIQTAYFQKGDKFNFVFMQKDKQAIMQALNPNRNIRR